jgi:hypothetical protein
MKPIILLAATAFAASLATGCRPVAESTTSATHTVVTGHTGGAYEAKNTTKYDVENRSKFVDMDYRVQRSVTCDGLQERILEDNRLEVAANMRNRLERRIEVQVQCVFKDAQGFSTGDETPWDTMILTENGQETKRFVSMNDKAKGYTIRVREAH